MSVSRLHTPSDTTVRGRLGDWLDGTTFANKGAIWCHYEVIGEWKEGSNSTVVNAADDPKIAAGFVVPHSEEFELIPDPRIPGGFKSLLGLEELLQLGVGTTPVFSEVSTQDRPGFLLVHGAISAAGRDDEPPLHTEL